MEIKKLLKKLRENQIDLAIQGNNLRVSSKTQDIPKDLLAAIGKYKPEIMMYISSVSAGQHDLHFVPRAVVKEDYPLSSSQFRLWFLSQLDNGNKAYNMKAVWLLEGPVDKDALRHAFRSLIQRHEILRTVFVESSEGVVRQRVRPKREINFDLRYSDLGDSPDLQHIEDIIESETEQPFDLAQGPLMRAKLLGIGSRKNLLIYAMHHIISDGWSLGVIINELSVLYNSFVRGEHNHTLQPLRIQYKDFSVWQNEELSKKLAEHKKYWLDKFSGSLPTLELQTDKPRPAVRTFNGDALTVTIGKELTQSLKMIGQQAGATFFMNVVAAVNTLFYAYTSDEDIILGTPIAGRDYPELEGQVGFYVNTIPLRTTFRGEMSFRDLLATVKEVTLAAYDHQSYPFDQLVNDLRLMHGLSRHPLFDVMVILQGEALNERIPQQLDGVTLSHYSGLRNNTSRFDLTFEFVESDDGLILTLEYNSDIFNSNTVGTMASHLKQVISAVIANPDACIHSLQFLTQEEEHRLLQGFNNTAFDFSVDDSIAGFFEKQAEQTPDAVAVIFEGQYLRYWELNEEANQLAHHLLNIGVNDDTPVPLCMERGLEMIIAIVALLKVGAPYVPVDPQYPIERIKYIIKDTAARIILVDQSFHPEPIITDGLLVLKMKEHLEKIRKEPRHNLKAVPSSQVAYVIYTSGSTGVPKGVMNEHKGVVNRLLWAKRYFQLTKNDTILQKTTYCFDVSVWELLLPLLAGAKLIFARPDGHRDNHYLKSVIEEQKISMIHFVPSMLESFLHDVVRGDCANLKQVICSGEALQGAHVALFGERLPHVQLHNLYGPTEAAIDATYWTPPDDVSVADIVPIGRPVANTSIYILDSNGRLSLPGAVGGLHIAGIQVARGYLNLPELTGEKFLADPFNKDSGARMYKTGDLGRWLPDGTLEYLGRIDEQVKIRGYRIELGEIESVLHQSGMVTQGVVIARAGTDGNKWLVAYLVSPMPIDKEKLTSFLRSKLPEYMIPSAFVELESIPLTPNGKVDRKTLLAIEPGSTIQAAYEPPANDLESLLVDIWQQVLRVDRIGVFDNFFELGGHSLLATRVISQVRKRTNAELKIKELFEYPTVRELARRLGQGSDTQPLALPVIEKKSRPSRIPLSFSQERLWFIDQLTGSSAYHMSSVLRLKGALQVDALNYALESIVNRHEVLRTVIDQEDGQAYQRVLEEGNWRLHLQDVPAHENGEWVSKEVTRLISIPFDLAQDHNLRAHLLLLGHEDHLLVVTQHHIASDGWSIPIMINELTELYNSKVEGRPCQLNSLSLQYADYAIWQRGYLSGEVLEKKLSYWNNKLSGVLPLNIPTDHIRTSEPGHHAGRVLFQINNELSRQINALSLSRGVTQFMTLLSAFTVLLSRYSGQEDICIGSPVANRGQEEIAGMIGFFVNMLALRTDLSGSPTFIQLLDRIKITTLEAYEHQDVPFEKVVESTVKERDMSRSPLFQILFTVDKHDQKIIDRQRLTGVTIIPEDTEQSSTKFDITLTITESANQLEGRIDYNKELFDQETIIRMSRHYVRLITAIVEQPTLPVDQFPLLTTEEIQQLVAFGKSHVTFPQQKTVVDLFCDQVEKTPDKTALVFESERLNYTELNQRTNDLAAFLIQKGVEPGEIVAVLVNRSMQCVISLLAVLKTGAAFVPIDARYPEERMRFMLSDIGCKFCITDNLDENKIHKDNTEFIDARHVVKISSGMRDHINRSKISDLAYVLYTSGSTGSPKGAMIGQRALMDHLYGLMEKTNFSVCTTFALVGTLSADGAHATLFCSLISGGELHVLSNDLLLDGEKMVRYFDENAIDFIKIFPSLWQSYADSQHMILPRKALLMGGEVLPAHLIEKLASVNYSGTVYNHYGPTETAIGKCIYEIDLNRKYFKVPIGKPFSNTQVSILDHNGQFTPVGIAGELHIGGIGIANGYLNRPEVTADKFVALAVSDNAKVYKTGDMARWLPDGNIEYLGRVDHQVKIRGFRIELGEIEAVLLESKLIRQAVVVIRESQSSRRLVAYVVPESKFDATKILSYLKHQLPDYMVPAVCVEVQSFFVTANGKVDRNRLPDVPNALLPHPYEEPGSHVEKALAKVWGGLLKTEKIGIHDNFFSLGGDSIISIQVVSRLRKAGYQISPKDLFMHQSIAELSKVIADREATPGSGEQGVLSGSCGLLPIQQQYFRKPPFSRSHFNQSILLLIDKRINKEMISETFKELLAFHDALRFQYTPVEENEWQQHYGEYRDAVRVEDMTFMPSDNALQDEIRKKIKFYQHDLSIEKGELIRAVLFQTGESEVHNRLFIAIHHLAVDGVSWRILLDDLGAIFSNQMSHNNQSLGKKGTSFRDWYNVLAKYASTSRLHRQLGHWRHVVKQYTPLRCDKQSPQTVTMRTTHTCSVTLAPLQTSKLLQNAPRAYTTEINDVLLYALAKTICEWCSTNKIVIGLEGHGREETIGDNIDLTRTVGWFTTLYPVLIEFSLNKDLGYCLKSVKEQLRKIPDKGVGFGVLKYLSEERDLAGDEPWDISFNYLGSFDNLTEENKWFKISSEGTEQNTGDDYPVQRKIFVNGFIRDRALILNWNYSSEHFESSTISLLAAQYLNNLVAIIDHCEAQAKIGINYTPSDYGLGAELTAEELDKFLMDKLQSAKKNIMDF